jgi:hypothetical protein
MKDERELDSMIDDVARGLIARDSPRLRAAVLARMDVTPRRRTVTWLVVAGLSAAACAFVLFAIVRTPSPVIERTRGVVTTPPLRDIAPSPAVNLAPAAAEPRRRVRPSSAVRRQAVTASADELAWQARAIAALEVPEPLTLEDIQPEPLELRPLVMTPLSVPAIEEAGQ